MSFKIRLISLVAVLALMLSLCGCAVKIAPPEAMSSEDEARCMGFSAVDYDGEIQKGSYEYLTVNIKSDYESEVQWSSSNPEIATVDSNGRVDGKKEGNVIITAKVKSASVDYEMLITKAPKATTSYSTALTSNLDYVSRNKASGDEKNLYAIIVNEYDCTVTVFTYNSNGDYNKAVRAMVCSTAKSPLVVEDEGERIEQAISEKAQWVELKDGNFYCYASYLGDQLMFCSTPYSAEDAGSLKVEDYNKLGAKNSSKNIWLSAADAKWIYDNCKEGTLVHVVNSSNSKKFSPLGTPAGMKLTENSASLNYDPTDNTKGNPYIKLKPQLFGAEAASVRIGSALDLYGGLSAVDTCGNDITSKIRVDGDIDVNKAGTYVVSCYATDDMGRTLRIDRQITVTD